MPIIFDGYALARNREILLKKKVDDLALAGKKLKIDAILFVEDQGSQLYTRLKKEAGARVGINYEVHSFSLYDEVGKIQQKIEQLNRNGEVTGIIIQKPWTHLWLEANHGKKSKHDFDEWWQSLTSIINENKDVDGLHPATLKSIQAGNWQEKNKVLPATARAVLEILQVAEVDFSKAKITIIGRSDLLGRPLFYELKNKKCEVEMIGTKELNARIEQQIYLRNSDVIISATGRSKLVTGEMVKDGAVVIDVGEPQPDVDFETVAPKARFITPVPGGVGPMTVVSLLENCVGLMI
jgi:methylenetetrahydrofolate dehydrogenase (NADP+) / methenyltetrahydrofolate cyclohydrolase